MIRSINHDYFSGWARGTASMESVSIFIYHTMSLTGFNCPNPHCDRHGKALLSERGLFLHLDSSPGCRIFTSSRPTPHNSIRDAFNIAATTSSLAPIIYNSSQNRGDNLYEATHLHDSNDDAIAAGSSHSDSNSDVLDDDGGSISSNNEKAHINVPVPEENGEDDSGSYSESYSSKNSEDHTEVRCDSNPLGIMTNNTTEVPSSCERPSMIFDFSNSTLSESSL